MHISTVKMILLQQYWRLKSVFSYIGSSIKELKWESCKLTRAEVVTLLNFLPNLNKLTISFWSLQSEFYVEVIPLLKLPDLRELNVTRCDQQTVEMLSVQLPKHCLQKLKLSINSPTVPAIFNNQRNISELELHEFVFIHPELLQNFRLTHFTLGLKCMRNLSSMMNIILRRQPNLLYLNILPCGSCFDGDDDAKLFEGICNLMHLKTLKMNIDGLRPSFFIENSSKLINLKEIEIESTDRDQAQIGEIINELSRMKSNHLQSLKLDLEDISISHDVIDRMGQNYPKLRSFNLKCERPLSLDVYLKKFAMLEKLELDYHYTLEFARLCITFDMKCIHLNSLHLKGFSFASDELKWNEIMMIKIMDVVPNLEILDVDANFNFKIELLFKILEKAKHLKTLKSLCMVQSADVVQKFDTRLVNDLIEISEMLQNFNIELKLKTFADDFAQLKEDLQQHFCSSVSRIGTWIVIRLSK